MIGVLVGRGTSIMIIIVSFFILVIVCLTPSHNN
jgi:hypothetical protein